MLHSDNKIDLMFNYLLDALKNEVHKKKQGFTLIFVPESKKEGVISMVEYPDKKSFLKVGSDMHALKVFEKDIVESVIAAIRKRQRKS